LAAVNPQKEIDRPVPKEPVYLFGNLPLSLQANRP
jgi:hypothetical protein